MDLRERLVDLTDDLADVRPPIGLWDQEVRRRRRARRDTVVVTLVALLAIAGLMVGDWHAARQPAPVSPTRRAVLPDAFFSPSKWLSDTHEGGLLGPLVAATSLDRGGFWGDHPDIAGVSASTGRYAFLDLPDYANQGWALAPDGRHLAYWATGTPSDGAEDLTSPVTAVNVYDAGTGQVRRAEIPTRHGLMVDSLVFIQNDALVISYAQFQFAHDDAPPDTGNYGMIAPTLLWRLSDPQPTAESFVSPAQMSQEPAIRGGRFWTSGLDDTGPALVDMRSNPPTVQRLGGPRLSGAHLGGTPEGALAPDGSRIAIVRSPLTTGRMPNKVAWYDLAGGKHCCGRGHVVPNSRGTFAVMTWPEADRVVTLRFADTSPDSQGLASGLVVASVDLTTGDTEVRSRLAEDAPEAFATELLASPTAPGVEPPHPWDPRVTWGGIVLVLLGAVWLIRQRRRRRGRP